MRKYGDGSKIIFVDAGTYMLSDTVIIGKDAKIVGETWSQFAAFGPKFSDPMCVAPPSHATVYSTPPPSVGFADGDALQGTTTYASGWRNFGGRGHRGDAGSDAHHERRHRRSCLVGVERQGKDARLGCSVG